MTGRIQTKADLWTGKMHLGGAPFAAHQRTQRKFDAEGASADRVAAIADCDVMQRKARRWQQARVDGAGHAYIDADKTARLCLEKGAMVAPIDQERTNQRCHERQNNRDRQSKQGGLQRQLRRRTRVRRASANHSETHAILAIYGGEFMSQTLMTAQRSCPDL